MVVVVAVVGGDIDCRDIYGYTSIIIIITMTTMLPTILGSNSNIRLV